MKWWRSKVTTDELVEIMNNKHKVKKIKVNGTEKMTKEQKNGTIKQHKNEIKRLRQQIKKHRLMIKQARLTYRINKK